MNFSPFLSIARQLYCLGNDPDHSIGTRKKWASSSVLSGVVVAMAGRTAETQSNVENSPFVLLLCLFTDVSNLHCGFIRLFPKQRVTLVEGFRQKVFLEGFSLATDTSCRTS